MMARKVRSAASAEDAADRCNRGIIAKRMMRALLALTVCVHVMPLLGQETPRPPESPGDARRGQRLFSSNCGICHGANAQGGDRAPNLVTEQFKHAKSDIDLFNVITRGISGTTMPPSALPPDEVWAIVTFLRSSQVAAHSPIGGNSSNGERLFKGTAKCTSCHMVNGQGGILGPDLSRVGIRRTLAYLTEKLRNPSSQLTVGLREPNADYVTAFANSTVTVVSKDGQRITGIPKNEDTFSIQILGVDGKIHLFLKRNLAEIDHQRRSLMPAYTDSELSDSDLKDVLTYLATLQGGL